MSDDQPASAPSPYCCPGFAKALLNGGIISDDEGKLSYVSDYGVATNIESCPFCHMPVTKKAISKRKRSDYQRKYQKEYYQRRGRALKAARKRRGWGPPV